MTEETQIENTETENNLDLNVASFMQEDTTMTDSLVSEPTETENKTETVEDNFMSWDDMNNPKEDVGSEFLKEEETETIENKETIVEDNEQTPPQQETKTISVDDAYNVLREELGLEATSVKELKKQLQELEQENNELKELKHNNIENDKISRLNQFKNLSDEALLLESFKRQGFSDEEAQNAVDRYIDNQMIDIEAKKIRKGIDNAIAKERDNHVRSTQQEEARLQKEREESIESLKQYMNGVDTMYGLKIAKDEDGLSNVRKEHLKYITSGTFLNEVTMNNENLVEASWLWKNRDVITKSFYNKGKNEERKEFLDELQNPETLSSSERFKGPGDEDGFNPSKFLST